MAESLLNVKARLQERYLGRFGIHALGASQTLNTIRIYYSPQAGVDVDRLAAEIRAEAAPYRVVMIREQPSVLM